MLACWISKFCLGSTPSPLKSKWHWWSQRGSSSPCGLLRARPGVRVLVAAFDFLGKIRKYVMWHSSKNDPKNNNYFVPGMKLSSWSTLSPLWLVKHHIAGESCSCRTSNLKVAELGGILGLFVGFSFLGLLDALLDVSCSTVSSLKTTSLQWCMKKRLQT